VSQYERDENQNTGIMLRNQRKHEDTHPDFTGLITIEGVDYWLTGWIKEAQPARSPKANAFSRAQLHQRLGRERSAGRSHDDVPF
jgi:hypothetical protein